MMFVPDLPSVLWMGIAGSVPARGAPHRHDLDQGHEGSFGDIAECDGEDRLKSPFDPRSFLALPGLMATNHGSPRSPGTVLVGESF